MLQPATEAGVPTTVSWTLGILGMLKQAMSGYGSIMCDAVLRGPRRGMIGQHQPFQLHVTCWPGVNWTPPVSTLRQEGRIGCEDFTDDQGLPRRFTSCGLWLQRHKQFRELHFQNVSDSKEMSGTACVLCRARNVFPVYL